MPATSKAQFRLMKAVEHSPKFAKKVGIHQSIAKEYNRADTGTKMLSRASKRNPGTERMR